jgi:hypothetical protein
MTVATLDDLGYSVDYSQADPYPVSKVRPSCLCSPGQGLEGAGDHNIFDGSKIAESVTDSGLEAAMASGKEMLEDMAASRMPDSDIRARQEDIEFVGDQVVFVLYRDDIGDVRSIAVEN